MNSSKPRAEARERHWLTDAGVGAAAALAAIAIAHAALPSPPAPSRAPPPAPPHRVDFISAPAPAAPVALISFSDPVPGRPVVSPFGLRELPWEESGRLHEGVDIAADPGEPVLAAADGVVEDAGTSASYGRYVAVRHAAGLTSFYAHLGAIAARVRPGLAVKGGEPLGEIGSSGSSTGPHLHFEIRDKAERPLNPALFLGRAFAEADELPLRKAQRFGRTVRIAQVSFIPLSKRAQMREKLARGADDALARAADDALAAAARDADGAATSAVGHERIEGLKDVGRGADGRPKATLSF